MMETIGSQVCEMPVPDFVVYKVESFQFQLGGKNPEKLLRRCSW